MTIAILAHQTGVPVGQAYAVLCDLAPRARKIGHGYKIKGAEIPAVRAALLASKRPPRPLPQVKEAPMNESKLEGVSLALIVQKTGTPEGTVKSLLSRHPELQEPPYSAKAAGARVFFPPFVAWLAEHQGSEVAKVAQPQPLQLRISGALLRELRLSVKAGILRPTDPRVMLGLDTPRPAIEAPAAPSEARLGFAALEAVAAGLPSDTIAKAARAGAAATEAVIRRELARVSADAGQGRLGL